MLLIGIGSIACDASIDTPTSGAATASARGQPAWAVCHGAKFWRRAPTRRLDATTGIDLSDAMERVTNAFRPADGGAQARVRAHDYEVTIERDGLRFSPGRTGDAQLAAG